MVQVLDGGVLASLRRAGGGGLGGEGPGQEPRARHSDETSRSTEQHLSKSLSRGAYRVEQAKGRRRTPRLRLARPRGQFRITNRLDSDYRFPALQRPPFSPPAAPVLSPDQAAVRTALSLRSKPCTRTLPTIAMRVASPRSHQRRAPSLSAAAAAAAALASSVALAASSTPCVIEGSSIGKFDLRQLRNKKRELFPRLAGCCATWNLVTVNVG